jgi:hypothetical protein
MRHYYRGKAHRDQPTGREFPRRSCQPERRLTSPHSLSPPTAPQARADQRTDFAGQSCEFARLRQERGERFRAEGFEFICVHKNGTRFRRGTAPRSVSHREFVSAGGLMSYGANADDLRRVEGNYLGRILKGEKSADLPVVQSTRFELVINLTTAKALGLTVSNQIQLLADDVIE